MITDSTQAGAIIREGKADVVLLARELLRDPYWLCAPPKSSATRPSLRRVTLGPGRNRELSGVAGLLPSDKRDGAAELQAEPRR